MDQPFILVGVDFSSGSAQAWAEAQRLAGRTGGAVGALHVVEGYGNRTPELRPEQELWLSGEGIPREALKELIDHLRAGKDQVAILLGLVEDGKVALIAAVSKELAGKKLHAGDAIKTAAKLVGGGGGGRPELAEAGGKDPSKLAEALEAGKASYLAKLA